MNNLPPIALALIGTGFTFFMTALGSAMVYFFRNDIPQFWKRILLGFAAGVMIAAAIWSLLIPAMEMAEEQNMLTWLPSAAGFLLGCCFLLLLDSLLPHLHPGSKNPEGLPCSLKRTTMLVFAVTLHNIPEGMAVGLSFALSQQTEIPISLAGAIALAIGMGLQNLPEGAAISLPLRQEGLSKHKAFLYGAFSGIVEPIGAVIAVLLASHLSLIMPWLLSFAAGAMIYVVVEELIPEANLGEHSHSGTIGVILGFVIMMILDIALG